MPRVDGAYHRPYKNILVTKDVQRGAYQELIDV